VLDYVFIDILSLAFSAEQLYLNPMLYFRALLSPLEAFQNRILEVLKNFEEKKGFSFLCMEDNDSLGCTRPGDTIGISNKVQNPIP